MLKLTRSIVLIFLRTSIARRFALRTESMQILVNDIPITKENLVLEHRYPDSGWTEEVILNLGKFNTGLAS